MVVEHAALETGFYEVHMNLVVNDEYIKTNTVLNMLFKPFGYGDVVQFSVSPTTEDSSGTVASSNNFFTSVSFVFFELSTIDMCLSCVL